MTNQKSKSIHILFSILIIVLVSFIHNCALGHTASFQELLLEVHINQQDIKQTIYALEDEKGLIYVHENTLRQWRWLLIEENAIFYENETFYRLDSFAELEYHIDRTAMRIGIHVPATLLPADIVDENNLQFQVLRPNAQGAYLNYDFSAQRFEAGKQTNIAGIAELGYFNFFGVGNSSFLIQNQSQSPDITRLNSTWVLDKPENMTSWRLGDSITGSNLWSGATRFAGIQYATNFSTQPGFATFPLPNFSGRATLPTTIDFFINNELRSHEQIDAGPFSIDGIPVITGASDLVIKTRDLLGRETIISLPYYTSTALLSKGLKNFSYEAGFIRNNFGIESNDYSHVVLAGTYNKGITHRWTAGWHAEILKNQQTFGITNNYLLSDYIMISHGLAASQRHQDKGGLISLGAQRLTQTYNLGFQAIAATPDYTQISLQPYQQFPKFSAQAFAGYSHALGLFGASYTSQQTREQPNTSLATFTYSRNIFNNFYLSLSWVKSIRGSSPNQLLLALVWSPADQYTASINSGRQAGDMQNSLQFSKNLPVGNGYGYRVAASQNQSNSFLANYAYQNDHGTYTSQVSRFYGKNNYEFDASGAVVYFGKDIFFTRLISDSFAVVSVPGFKGVRIYDSNQLIGQTNRHGNLLIPRVLPYQPNDIRIDVEDLPINARIDADQLFAYPYFHSGTLIKFPVYPIQTVTFCSGHRQWTCRS